MRYKKLFIPSALLALVSPLQGQLLTKSRPNVVLIIADDHRYDWMKHKGRSFLETPYLDRLAKEGWSFANAFSCAGVCSPARASIFTGKYMHQASSPSIVWQNNSFLQLQEMFPQTLHMQGYKTGYIGKFHLGEEEKPKPGFDLWASFPFVGNYFDQPIWVNGKAVVNKGFTDDNIASMAVQTVKEWSKESKQPFCLVVGLKSPHIPFTYPERMKAKYGEVVFTEPETFNLDYSKSKPGLSKNLINAKTWANAIPKYGSFQEWVRSYSRLATTLDESVGQIMDAIDKAGIADNTIFIYTSDQGYSLGELSLCEKHYAYEQIMRVPLIVRFPNQKDPGKPPLDMVMNMDIAPTIMDYCTGKIPTEMMGKSWRELLDGKNNRNKPFREEFFFDFWHDSREALPPMQAVRTSKYKLIRYEYQPYEELYDLKNDPVEKNNLIDDAQYNSVRNDLEKRLTKWKKETGWESRSIQKLNSIYISEMLSTEEDLGKQAYYANSTINEVVGKKGLWEKLNRNESGFNLLKNTLSDNSSGIIYVAIPLNNEGKFDPFISVRLSYPKRTEVPKPVYTAWFEGKEIFMSMEYKKKTGIPIDNMEEPLRQMFDLGYNPPLRHGENLVILRFFIDKNTPANWDFTIVGGLSKIKWL